MAFLDIKSAASTTTLKGKYTESLTFSTAKCIYANYGKLGKPSLHTTMYASKSDQNGLQNLIHPHGQI